MTEQTQHAHFLLDVARIDGILLEPRIARHHGLGHDVARIDEMHAVPGVAVSPADALQIRAGALRAPLKRAIVDELAGDRVMAVALGLGAKRADHLRVTRVAGLANVDIHAGELERVARLEALYRCRQLSLKELRHHGHDSADADDEQNQNDHPADIGLELLVS